MEEVTDPHKEQRMAQRFQVVFDGPLEVHRGV